MKRNIKKWAFRLTVTGLFISTLLFVIILNPAFVYANKTTYKNFTIYHHSKLNPLLISYVNKATELLKTSELYRHDIKLDICLNEGSVYPSIVSGIAGQGFAFGFYNKVVLLGKMNCHNNTVEINGYNWNLTQLLAHEITHCLQFNNLGFWHSNPIAAIDNWKWEGYAEYVARQEPNQKDVYNNLHYLNENNFKSWGITLQDNSIAPAEYFNYWVMVQYCMNIKHMPYKQLLNNTTNENTIKHEMMTWYKNKKTETRRQHHSY
ncbi:MAG: hypothetical protein EAZ51_04825 [Sphingobacteriales bacterium]|nr:MAG: hypothetical protein EAZ64_01400 [Sphingobacteriales bacterium]TAF81081.1 MAG: hypothetical protein EAZ51_04825 [Sphingobacteriales bacterium]